jgi:hypothetical protein
MRRLLSMAGGLAMVAGLTTAGLAGAAGSASAASPATSHRLTPGSVWTQTNLADHGCEVETIEAGDTFTADVSGDAGTFTQNYQGITETWTTGRDKGQTLRAGWAPNAKEYKGRGSGGVGGGTKWKTTIVAGKTPKC